MKVRCSLFLDAVRYQNDTKVSLDLEIIEGEPGTGVYEKGKRYHILQNLDTRTLERLKIGQILKADFSGSIDDLGSGKISLDIQPETIRILSDPEFSSSIRFSLWEPLFPYIFWFQASFILSFWFAVFILISKPHI
ncbi:hypothetical protein HYY75_09385 [bacterium]|nr:hypothetical protein [bacterium]